MRSLLIVLVLASIGAEPMKRTHTNLERLAPARLKATHDDIQNLSRHRVSVPPRAGFTDYRCILHAHAEDSTHTGGTLVEMLDEAKKAGVNAILLSDHFRPPRDFIDGRWRGIKEGVLFIPGSETNGFLIHPTKSILKRMDLKGMDFIETVSDGDGLIFLSHLEERREHPVEGLTGMEIYNRHWDAKQDKLSLLALGFMLTDPKQLAELQQSVKSFPDELFAFQCEYPKLYLDKWDEGTQRKRLTGVAANDCHHNQILLVKMEDDKSALIGTNVDEDAKMQKLTTSLRPGIRAMTIGRKPGDILARVDLDPYSRSFRNSATHVLAPKLDEAAIRTALKAGHAYVSHDWMGDAAGFRFEAERDGKPVAMMGDELKFAKGMKFAAMAPFPCHFRLIRNGEVVAQLEDRAEFSFEVKAAGVYRIEAWMKLDGEHRPWIYSNPIYVR